MAITDPLVGDNIFDHMRHTSELKERTHYYFRCKSKLWKAIVDHITHKKDVILAPKPTKDCSVVMHCGTGPEVSLRDVSCFAKDYKEERGKKGEFLGYKGQDVAFWVEFDVTWHSGEYGEEVDRKYELTLPCDMELNFSEAKFEKWVKEYGREKMSENYSRQLEELVRKLPECDERKRIIVELDKIRQKFRVRITGVGE